MKIFIVEDLFQKIEKIKTVVLEADSRSLFYLAKNKADAMDVILNQPKADLMILDLNLPNRKGENPKRLSGLSLLREINRRKLDNKPKHIIGLTAYTDIKAEVIDEFARNGWVVIAYDNTKSEWEDVIKNKIEYIKSKDPLENVNKDELALIMKGGGIKGLAYVGALSIINNHYNFNWYAGTSAGAITAVLLSAGYNNKELKEILYSKNFNDFKDAGFLKKIWNLITKRGLYEANTFTNWIEVLLSKKLDQTTEVKLSALPHRTTIYASSINKDAEIFDSKDDKMNHIGAGLATRASMSIPYIFVPQNNFGKKVYDGGLQNNFPVEILLKHNPNAKFIGLYLGDEFYKGTKFTYSYKDIFNIWLESRDEYILDKYKDEIIVIDTHPISTLQFDLTNREKNFLIKCGEYYALKFLLKKKLIKENEANLTSRKQQLDHVREGLQLDIKNHRERRWILFIVIILGVTILSIIF